MGSNQTSQHYIVVLTGQELQALKTFSPSVFDTTALLPNNPESEQMATERFTIPVGNICPSPEEQSQFIMSLAHQGYLDHEFSGITLEKAYEFGEVPRGFSVRYLLPFNKDMTHTTSPLCLMENSIVRVWDALLPHLTRLQSQHMLTRKRRLISTALPRIPYVMRQKDFKQIRHLIFQKAHLNKKSKAYHSDFRSLNRYTLLGGKGLLLYRKDLTRLLENTDLIPMAIEIKQPSMKCCKQLKKEYEGNKKALVSQLASQNNIPGLSEQERQQTEQTGILPKGYPYSCHHMIPRILGGTNAISNLCYLPHGLHRHIHKLLRDYERYLASMAKESMALRLFVVLPMPTTFEGSALRIIQDKNTVLKLSDTYYSIDPRRLTTQHTKIRPTDGKDRTH